MPRGMAYDLLFLREHFIAKKDLHLMLDALIEQ